MLFVKHRDWTPKDFYEGYELGFMEHDDGDVVKWDWTIYKFVEERAYDDRPLALNVFTQLMYEKVCSLDVSPYERNMNTIRDLFQKQVTKLIDNDS
tara:strand:- start:524 stop:811 length:288 start_codon:yes stop_codon:yes gene_type:complete